MNKGFFNTKKDTNVPSVNVDDLAASMKRLKKGDVGYADVSQPSHEGCYSSK